MIPWGKIAARKIYKSLSEEDIIRSVIRLIEKRPDPSIQFSTLIDCEDVCLRQVSLDCNFGYEVCLFRAGPPNPYSK